MFSPLTSPSRVRLLVLLSVAPYHKLSALVRAARALESELSEPVVEVGSVVALISSSRSFSLLALARARQPTAAPAGQHRAMQQGSAPQRPTAAPPSSTAPPTVTRDEAARAQLAAALLSGCSPSLAHRELR